MTALLSAACGVANAADARGKAIDFSVRTEAAPAVGGPKALKWDARKGRWGLTLDLQQPDTRAATMNDVQAGAYYRITPSLRVGGAVAFGDEQPLAGGPRKITPAQGQPRVQFETRFKF